MPTNHKTPDLKRFAAHTLYRAAGILDDLVFTWRSKHPLHAHDAIDLIERIAAWLRPAPEVHSDEENNRRSGIERREALDRRDGIERRDGTERREGERGSCQ